MRLGGRPGEASGCAALSEPAIFEAEGEWGAGLARTWEEHTGQRKPGVGGGGTAPGAAVESRRYLSWGPMDLGSLCD